MNTIRVADDLPICEQLSYLWGHKLFCRATIAFASCNYINAGRMFQKGFCVFFVDSGSWAFLSVHRLDAERVQLTGEHSSNIILMSKIPLFPTIHL